MQNNIMKKVALFACMALSIFSASCAGSIETLPRVVMNLFKNVVLDLAVKIKNIPAKSHVKAGFPMAADGLHISKAISADIPIPCTDVCDYRYASLTAGVACCWIAITWWGYNKLVQYKERQRKELEERQRQAGQKTLLIGRINQLKNEIDRAFSLFILNIDPHLVHTKSLVDNVCDLVARKVCDRLKRTFKGVNWFADVYEPYKQSFFYPHMKTLVKKYQESLLYSELTDDVSHEKWNLAKLQSKNNLLLKDIPPLENCD